MVTITISTTLIQVIANTLSVLACLWLLKLYHASSSHSLDSRMITTLASANLLFHIFSILNLYFTYNWVTNTYSWSLLFALSWAAYMAVLINRSASRGGFPSSRGVAHFVWLVLPALLFSIIFKVLERRFNFSGLIIAGVFTAEIVVIVLCYIRTLYIVKQFPVTVKSSTKARMSILGLYPLVEAIAVGLLVFDADMAAITSNKFMGIFPVFACALAGLAGVGVALIHIVQRKSAAGDLTNGLV